MIKEIDKMKAELEKVRESAQRKVCWRGNSEGKSKGGMQLKAKES